MKHVLAIGDLGDTDVTASNAVAGGSSSSSSSGTSSAPVRKAAGPAIWVQQSDGSWAIKWRNNDTWWDLSQRYLQAGKRYKELFNYQSDAFHARVPQPIAIYTGALVSMPPEAVQRAQLLGEIAGGSNVQPSPGPSPSPGPGPVTPGPGPSPTPTPGGGGNISPVPGPSGGGSVTPGGGGGVMPKPSGGGGGGPIVLPSGQLAAGNSTLHWWLLGGLGLAVVTTIGAVVYHHSSQQRAQHGGRHA